MKKVIQLLIRTLLAVVILVNLVILFSGRFYLYKGIWNTYLQGRMGPSSTEYAIFDNRTVNAGNPQPWLVSKSYNASRLPAEYLQFFQASETHAFIVIRNDSLLHEQYWDGFSDTSLSNSFSMSKSYISALLGCALRSGAIKSLDEPVSHYIPEFANGKRAAITLRHLATMTSGLDFDESYINPFGFAAEGYYGDDLLQSCLHHDVIETPGKTFRYLSGNSFLLGYCIQKATGKHLSQYLSEQLWTPLGCEHPALWSLDRKDGDEKGFCCINSNARDFARLGQLYLNYGRWKDQVILDSNYIVNSLRPYDCREPDGSENKFYGYSWWLDNYQNKKVFYATGILGQFIICLPEEHMVICRLSRKRSEALTAEGLPPNEVALSIDAALQMYGPGKRELMAEK